jgi:hypothetical protein
MDVKYSKYIIIILVFLLFISCKTKPDNVISNEQEDIVNEQENIIVVFNPKSRDNIEEDYYYYTLIYNTNIETVENDVSNILLKTRAGCSQTGFYLKRDYYSESKYVNRIYVASTMEELFQIQDRFIYLPYLETFSADYFENYYLVFAIAFYTGGSDLRNERIERNNGEYTFNVEFWYKGIGDGEGVFSLCAYIGLFVLEISKG